MEQISERLGGSLDLLTRGGRTAVTRQRTLKGTLDWSYELLSEDEKKLFGRLSIFSGGWTLKASEAVGSGEDIEEGEVLDLLSGLVEKSLVMARESDQAGARYRLLEPVRQYALQKLEENEQSEAAKRAHAEYFLALAEEAEPQLIGPREVEWFDRLEEEHDNIRAALTWSLEDSDAELGLRLAGAMQKFWYFRGHSREGQKWLEEELAKGDGASAIARAGALLGVGWQADGQGDLDRMRKSATEGLTLVEEAGLGDGHRALFLNVLGDVTGQEGDYEQATKLLEESLAFSRKANDALGIVHSLLLLGHAAGLPGDHNRARAFFEEGQVLSRELGSAFVRGSLPRPPPRRSLPRRRSRRRRLRPSFLPGSHLGRSKCSNWWPRE